MAKQRTWRRIVTNTSSGVCSAPDGFTFKDFTVSSNGPVFVQLGSEDTVICNGESIHFNITAPEKNLKKITFSGTSSSSTQACLFVSKYGKAIFDTDY